MAGFLSQEKDENTRLLAEIETREQKEAQEEAIHLSYYNYIISYSYIHLCIIYIAIKFMNSWC